jgi:hypothetical protein
MFFSSVLGVFGRRQFSVQVLLLQQFHTLEVSFKLQLQFFDNQALHFIILELSLQLNYNYNLIELEYATSTKEKCCELITAVILLLGI